MAVIRQRGDTWQAIVRVKQQGEKYEESRTFASERLAKDWAGRLEATIKLNGIPQRVKSSMTLGQLLLDYKDAVHPVKPMRRQMCWEIDQLAQEFKSAKLNQLTSKLFTDFGRRRAMEGTGGATILHNLSTVRGILNAAKPVLGIDVNGETVTPAVDALSRIGAVSRSKSRTRRPTEEELQKLYAEFQRTSHHPCTIIPMETIVKLAVELPRRLGELLSMQWIDYVPGQQVTLRDTKHPTEPRLETVPVPKAAAAIIDALPKTDARILPYNPESVSASFERTCSRLGIQGLRFHDLRHEGISRLFTAGLDIPDVALISGHKSWVMLKRYTQLTPESVLEKLNASS